MSYILDALKRADAERERGAVPGLQSRHATIPAAQADSRARNRVWLAAAAVLALGAMAAGLWFWQMPAGGVRLAAVEPAVTSPPVPAPLAQPVPTPAPLPPIPASPPAVAPRAVASSPPAVVRAAPKPVPKPAPPASAAAMQATPKPKPDPVAKAAATQATPAAVPLLGDLPEGLRRDIPALAITGSVYSANPAQRLLLVNNQVLGQGSQAAPGVNLEEIHAKSSVFSFRGTRFRVAH